MAITVIKYNGDREDYNSEKVLSSLRRSGVDKDKLPSLLQEIEKNLPQLVSTKDLYRIVYRTINSSGSDMAAKRYRIREALSKIDSIEFEKIISGIFSMQNMDCSWNQIVLGRCIEHQIDVIAADNHGKHLIEVKRHTNPHKEVGLGTVVELWGRVVDINEARSLNKSSGFVSALLVTNSKFSEHAKKFSWCRKIGLLGWRYNSTGLFSNNEIGLETIIELVGNDKVLNLLPKQLTE